MKRVEQLLKLSSNRLPQLTFGPYAFDPVSRVLRRSGEELPLPPRVVGVLEVLLSRAGDVVPRQELIDSVWKDAFVTDTSLAEAVSALRQALGDDPQAPTYVQTLHRRGYRFVAPVEEVAGASSSQAGRAGHRAGGADIRPSIGTELVPWSVAAISLVLAAVAVWQAVGQRRTVEPPVVRFALPLSAGTRLAGRGPALAVSRGGTLVAWCGCDSSGCRLYLRRLDRLSPEVVPGSDGATAPFFSPDGRSLGFFADGKLKTVSLAGGAPVAVADAPDALGAVWTERRQIIYAGSATGGLLRVSELGNEPATVTAPRTSDGEVAHAWPALTPSGDVLMFTILGPPGATRGRLGAMRTDTTRTDGGWRLLITGVGVSAAAASDIALFSRGGELQAAWLDPQRLSFPGAPPIVLSQLSAVAEGAHFAVSPAGLLLTAEAARSRSSFAWIGSGREQPATDLDRELTGAALSSDGGRLAGLDEGAVARADIWIADLLRGTTTRLTHGGLNAAPVWSGNVVYYASTSGRGPYEVWRREVDSPAAPVRVHAASGHVFPAAVTPDGRTLAVVQQGETTRADLWLVPLDGGTPAPLVQTPFDEWGAAFSPDGKFAAYQGTDGGRWDVYAQRLADRKRVLVSRTGGTRPVWSPDGSALYYQAGREIVRAPFDGRVDLQFGPPVQVAAIGDAEMIGIDRGGRVLTRRPPLQPSSAILAMNWLRELRHQLGPPPAVMPR